MNQGKLEAITDKMAKVNIDILGISELKWTEMGEFNSDVHYIYYLRQEPLSRNAVPTSNLKNDKMISVCFQGKAFSITVIQVYAPTLMAKKLKLNGSMKNYKIF